MRQKFSVLMSLYIKEQASYFEECMDSILGQTVIPDEIVIVEDGPLTEELYVSLDQYKNLYSEQIQIVPLEENQGLGCALAEGIKYCSYDLIARMDTDDIARKDRFEKQLKCFENDPALDICGSHIIEFSGTVSNVLSKRKVPLNQENIAKYQRRRSAFNHMSVMFKKKSVLKAGNYRDALLMEDDDLWVRMLLSGAKCMNIDDSLVYVRTGEAMIARRGGLAYFKKYQKARKKILETGFISNWDYFITSLVQFAVALTPGKARMFIFTKLLRKE